MKYVYDFLDMNNIKYKIHEHPAVYTAEDSKKQKMEIPGVTGKNLVLRDKKGKNFFLAILPLEKRADLKQIGEIVGESKLSFASPNFLETNLGVKPGSVSPFCLINDNEKLINLYIDQEILDADIVNFHPNINTASLEITKEMFEKYLNIIGYNVGVLRM